jgi:FMN-dependent NADH-azoreductase
MLERILHISASPRKARSVSAQLAATFLEELGRQKKIEIDHLDVWECDIPEVNANLLAAKYAGLSGEALSAEQAAAWDQITTIAERFHRADTLLFSVPLWNFGIPYKLKHLIDAISQKGVLFSFDERGLSGLLNGRRAVAIYARGLDYSKNSQTPDHLYGLEKLYLDTWFKFVGIDRVHSIVTEQTLGPSGVMVRKNAGAEVTLLAQSIDSQSSRSIVVGRDA